MMSWLQPSSGDARMLTRGDKPSLAFLVGEFFNSLSGGGINSENLQVFMMLNSENLQVFMMPHSENLQVFMMPTSL